MTSEEYYSSRDSISSSGKYTQLTPKCMISDRDNINKY